MMPLWYGLDGKPIDMFAAEALLRDDLARRIAHTTLFTEKGTVTVSTVFLVLDHNHSGSPPPSAVGDDGVRWAGGREPIALHIT